ncbi:MAG: M20 family metallo-hydrolase [Spirochaetales bacterium]|nr:M20 family metallo-hydrolase [Spirochaetales bacterium]
MSDTKNLFDWIDSQRGGMISLQKLLTGIPALAPESEGEGEDKKARALAAWLEEQGLGPVENYPVKDSRVPSGARPNLVVTVKGKESSGAFWVMSHLDVVPPGDLSKWDGDPYTLKEKGGKLYGRGVEDNQQGLVSSVFAALALVKNGVTPPRDFKLLFAADEEVGSAYGIEALLREHSNLFHAGDSFLVPDGGRPDGSMIEIAEKTILWLRFSVEGKQCHGSMPHLGNNAFVAGSALVLRLAETLPKKFSREDPIFEPPFSTFCPTRKEANVPNVNTIPGLDVFWMDCRILPSENADDILAEIDNISRTVEAEYKVKVKREVFQRKASRPTPADCALVGRLKKAVKEVRGVDAQVKGVGGGTVGAYLRNAGYDTVIWSTIEETCHMPNEYCVIDNMVNDAKVMLLLGF